MTEDDVGAVQDRPRIKPPTKAATLPCTYPAGSRERVEAYRLRVERGERVFHDSDAKTIIRPTTGPNPGPSGIKVISLRELCA